MIDVDLASTVVTSVGFVKAIEIGVSRIISWSKQKDALHVARRNGEREEKESAFMTESIAKTKQNLINSYQLLQLCEGLKNKLDSESPLSKQMDRLEAIAGQCKDMKK